MIFITGGFFQGKTDFAKTFSLPIVNNLEDKIKEWLKNSADVESEIEKILENKNCVVVCSEIGCGIVPLEKSERVWREIVGRVSCDIAKKSTEVYRMQSCIAMRIK
ncbi:MAG: bifunctional adenosylcobinamide kinase/adenosylcobinamide-phosphate guanylyltransferase [Clostridia bacterium]